ncbi:MAG: PH domain-containing protein [Anaerolineales bacterium]|nr:PH domain-containing protein [Anaerolineales bacterium]
MNTNEKYIYREYPTALWFFSGVVLATGGYLYVKNPDQWVILVVSVTIGLLILLLASILIVQADKSTGLLTITSRSLLRRKVTEIPIREITAVRVEQSRGQDDDGRRQTSYRIAVDLASGESVPFRSYYSSGFSAKAEEAQELRTFLGVSGEDQGAGNVLDALSSMAVQAQERARQELESTPTEERLIKGIRFKVQRANIGSAEITRLFTTEVTYPQGFLYLAQTAKGQSTGKGLLASVSKTLFQQSIGIYGFGEADTPNREFGEVLSPLEPSLETHFMAYCSDPEIARGYLTPSVSRPLAAWGEGHPLKTVNFVSNANQLIVLFSPRGLYLAVMGSPASQALDQIAALGADLVQATRMR